MCVLCTDQQLLDLERFCTQEDFSTISVDPTFNLGSFYVTPISFQNLLVQTTSQSHPVILGPILIHQTKLFRPFHYFASTLTRLNPNLVNIRAFGTDGEPELIKAFKLVFTNAVHLRCANHLRRNIKDKLHALKLKAVAGEIISDIFGKQIGNAFESGLIDSETSQSFWQLLHKAKERWNNLERSCNPSMDPSFYDWFCKHKASEIVSCAILGVRKRAGFTSLYTTNNSESINHVIKQEVEWKENKLPILIQHLKNVVDRQVGEIEKAVIGRGEWEFSKDHLDLAVAESTWFSGETWGNDTSNN
uniref:MULE transposase domain-containing protein n=1 Tax=Amphimedon queenslandica TaxID=400682 RepID=A0A1X7SJT8_AMPQE